MEIQEKEDSLERNLFEWEGWDEMDVMAINFHDIVLKVDIEIHKKGEKFDWATIDFKTSVLEFGNGDDGKPTGRYKLNLVVGDALQKDGE